MARRQRAHGEPEFANDSINMRIYAPWFRAKTRRNHDSQSHHLDAYGASIEVHAWQALSAS